MKAFREEGDGYTVEADGAAGFVVRHFPTREAQTPCCQVRVRVSDRDRARAIPDADPHGVAACLHRAYLAIEARHVKARAAEVVYAKS